MTRAVIAALITLAAAADVQPTPQQERACGPDALRLCGTHMNDPRGAEMRACMVAHKAQLSAACREAIR